METIRPRVGSAFEWIMALALLAGTIGVGLLITQQLRSIRTPAPLATEAPVAPPNRPPLSVSVSALTLDGVEIRVGDALDRVTTLLGRAIEDAPELVERGRLGERRTRSYTHARMRFVVVFEPFEADGPLRVSAIYVR